MSKNNDAAIKELLAKVEEQKANLGARGKVALETNGIFKRDSSNFFNLNTVSDPQVLANALGFLLCQEKFYLEACEELGIKAEKFKWDGYPVDDWSEDFKTRIRILEWERKKKALEATKQKLDTLVSEEAKTEMELEGIQKLLASL